MISIAHPTSNANSRNTALALQKSGRLKTFYTCLNWNKDSIFNKFLPQGIVGELSRRSFPAPLKGKIETYPYYELARLSAQKLGWSAMAHGRYSIHQIYVSFGKYVANQIDKSINLHGVHCYEDGALEIFKAAKEKGAECIYELPIAYWKFRTDLFEAEKIISPEWAKTLALHVPHWLQDRKEKELELADRIIVPSEFVMHSLVKYHPNLKTKVNICAYGAPITALKNREVKHKQKIKVLFVGSIGQRKGVSYLFEIFKAIESYAEITVIGNYVNPEAQAITTALNHVNYLGSVPFSRVISEMANNDVFLLPTLCEGQALVNLEAMGSGMAVITTPNSGASDFIEHQKDGFLIPIRNTSLAIDYILQLHKEHGLLQKISNAAMEKAKVFSWEAYQDRYLRILDKNLAYAI